MCVLRQDMYVAQARLDLDVDQGGLELVEICLSLSPKY